MKFRHDNGSFEMGLPTSGGNVEVLVCTTVECRRMVMDKDDLKELRKWISRNIREIESKEISRLTKPAKTPTTRSN